MNRFEKNFFGKYVPEGQEIKGIIHEHWVRIIGKLFFWMTAGAFIPTFLYTYSERLQSEIPLMYLQGFLILVYIKIVYEIFNWYNDVWIVTDKGVVDLDWELWSTDMKTVNYENIEGQEVEQNGIWDTILRKGDIVLHKIGDDNFRLKEAVDPYGAINMIEKHSSEVDVDEDHDRFDMILDSLGGVMEDFLERKGIKNPTPHKETSKKIDIDENTIDLR
ncbi:hypothetical protein OAN96_01430 [Candidatus Gracilibacteria bacterium]|nr:hypothetical protein [Candidatus Gracilibacteria bacterium]